MKNLLSLLVAVPMLSAAEPSSMPQRFSASIGGFMGSSYRVELQDGVLNYTVSGGGSNNPKKTAITPTAAQWEEFRKVLDDVKLWQWRAEYANAPVKDGTQWSLDIAFPDHAIKSHGSNNYPDDAGKPNGEPDPTKAFKRYLDAISKLSGGKDFK